MNKAPRICRTVGSVATSRVYLKIQKKKKGSEKADRMIKLGNTSNLGRKRSYSEREDWKTTMHIASNIGLQSRMTLRRKTNVYTMQNTFTQLNSNLALQIHATWNSTVISSLHFLGMTEIITWGSRNPGRLAGTQNKYISHIHKLKRNHEHFETIYYLVNRKATSPTSYSLLVISTPHSEHADDK